MKTILIVNHHSMRNAGDAALLQVTVDALRGARVLVSSNHPGEAELARLPVTRLPAPLRSGSLSGLLRACRQADVVVSCPGNPFFSMGRLGKPFLFSALPVWLAQVARKPLVVLPQTLGPFYRGWERGLLRGLYSRAMRVWVRDHASLRLGQAWQLPGIAYAPDPTFLLEAAPVEEARALLERYGLPQGCPALGVTVMPWMTRTLNAAALERYHAALGSAMARFAVDSGVTPVFFAQCSGPTPREDDRIAAARVLEYMGRAASRAVQVLQPVYPPLLKACYGQMGALVASRLHAGLFALGMGAPALFVGYLPKTHWVLESLNCPDWGLSMAEADENALYARLADLWATRNDRSEWLSGELPRWKAAAAVPFAALDEFLNA